MSDNTTLNDRLFWILRQRFPEATDSELWQAVAMLLVAVADHQGVSLD